MVSLYILQSCTCCKHAEIYCRLQRVTVINHRYALSVSFWQPYLQSAVKESIWAWQRRCLPAHPFGNNYVGINCKYRGSKQHNCDFVVTRVLTKCRKLSNYPIARYSLHWSCAHSTNLPCAHSTNLADHAVNMNCATHDFKHHYSLHWSCAYSTHLADHAVNI